MIQYNFQLTLDKWFRIPGGSEIKKRPQALFLQQNILSIALVALYLGIGYAIFKWKPIRRIRSVRYAL